MGGGRTIMSDDEDEMDEVEDEVNPRRVGKSDFEGRDDDGDEEEEEVDGQDEYEKDVFIVDDVEEDEEEDEEEEENNEDSDEEKHRKRKKKKKSASQPECSQRVPAGMLPARPCGKKRPAPATRGAPSRVKQETLGAQAFALSSALFVRDDAADFDNLTSLGLAHESARAQLYALELAHMTGRRCLQLDRNSEELKRELKAATEEIVSLKEKQDISKGLLASLKDGMDAETARQLLARASVLEKEVAGLRAQNRELTRAFLPPPPRSNRALANEPREQEEAMRRTAISAVKHTFCTLKGAGLLSSDAAWLTVEEVVPELFLPVPEPEDSESERSEDRP